MLVAGRIPASVVALALLVSVSGSARGQASSDRGATVFSVLNAKPMGGVQLVDADRDLQDALAKIGENIAANRPDDVVEGILALVNADRPVLFPMWDDPRRYISSSEVATRILGLLPPETVEKASRQVEGAARRHCEEGIRDQREETLLRTGRQYFHTPSGADAWNALASLAFDRGAFIEAAHLWETLYKEQRLSRLDRPLVLAKAAVAAHMGGWNGKAADLAGILARTHAGAKAAIGGREQNVLEFVGLALATPAPRRVAVPVAAKWESVGGAADGFAVMPECSVSPMALWRLAEGEAAGSVKALLRLGGDKGETGQTKVDAEFRGGRVRVTIRRPGEEDFSFNLPATVHPVVFSDGIVCRREDGISSVAADSGREVWRTAYPMCRGDAAGRTVNHYLPLAGDLGRYTISAGEGLMFAVGRFRRLDPDTYSKFASTLEMDTSSLAAFSVADGKPVWEVGCGKGDTDAIRNAKYLTAPTYWGGRVYAIAKCGNRYQAVCLEARTGRRVWDVPVGPIPTHSGEQMSWQAAYTMEIMTERASPPSVANGVVYLTTNSGLVMALEAETGVPLWAYRYESRVSTTADTGRSFEVANMAFLIAASRRPFPPANPVLVIRGRVIAAPSDCDAVLALHALSGEKLWQSSRQGRRDLSAVDDNRVLLSGPDFLFLNVNDGAAVRQVDADVEDRPAVTRAAVVASGQGRFVRIELSDYSVHTVAAAEPQAVLGRLVGSGGRLVAVNGAGVSVYLGFDDAWETLARRLKEATAPAQRMEWLLQRGSLALQANKTAQAVAEFRAAGEQARAAGPEAGRNVQPMFLRSLLRLAGETKDEGEAMRCVAEADGVAADEGERISVRLVRMGAFERFGKVDQAVAAAQSIADTDGNSWMGPGGEGRDAGEVPMTRYRWAQREIGEMIRRHGQAVYAEFDARMSAAVDRARQAGDAGALLAAQRRWPHAARANEALYAAAETLWRRGGDSPSAAVAARVDRILGAIGGPGPFRERATAAQLLIDTRFRPSRISGYAEAGTGLTTNSPVSFGDYSGSITDLLESARRARARFPVESAFFAGVTGAMAVAWILGDGGTAILRSHDGGYALPDERRLCVHDEQSVRCYDVQGGMGMERPLWSVGVPRVGNSGGRTGYYCGDGNALAIVTAEHIIVVDAGTGRELARKTTREMGVYPWTRVLGDGGRLLFANDRQDWIACVAVPRLSRDWFVRQGGFRDETLMTGTDIVMVCSRWHNSARFLDLRTGRQVLNVECANTQAAMNGDGFCASIRGERPEYLDFNDPHRPGEALIWRMAFTNTPHDLVAFGDRHAIVREKRNGSMLGMVDIAGPQTCTVVRLEPQAMTNRVVMGVAWGTNAVFVLSGSSDGRSEFVSALGIDGVHLADGSIMWHRDLWPSQDRLCGARGFRKYGEVLSLLVIPHGESVAARHMVVGSSGGAILGDFSEPFGMARRNIARTPEWAGGPVVLNGRIVIESSVGLVCFAEPL